MTGRRAEGLGSQPCAGCGATVKRIPYIDEKVWRDESGVTACLIVLDDYDDLIQADYHYVDGETQRHWP